MPILSKAAFFGPGRDPAGGSAAHAETANPRTKPNADNPTSP